MTEDFNEKIINLIEVTTALMEMLMITFKKQTPEPPDPEVFERIGVR